MNIASYIDHTLLRPQTTDFDVEKLCAEAAKYQFAAVCIPPYFVSLARRLLTGTEVKVATVIGFPFGYCCTAAKVAEIKDAIANGADELDIVQNIAALKSGDWRYMDEELKAMIPLIHGRGKVVKIIIESGILSDAEIIRSCDLCARYNVDYVKTSTGYTASGASVHAVSLMRKSLPGHIKIKASGGIRDYPFASELIKAGADRIGASSGVKIVENSKK